VETNVIVCYTFLFFEPGITNHQLANNVIWASIISIVARLLVVMLSNLGPIPSKGILYK